MHMHMLVSLWGSITRSVWGCHVDVITPTPLVTQRKLVWSRWRDHSIQTWRMKKLNYDQSAQPTQPLHHPPHQPPSSTPTSFLHTNHHSHNTHSFTSSLPVQWCILPKKHNPQTPLVSQPSLHPWISVKPIFISLFQLQVPPVKGQSTPESLLNRGLMATPSWVSCSFFFPFLFSFFPFSFFFLVII